MNHLLLDYLPAYILVGSLATVASVLIGIQRGLKRAGWPDNDRRRAIGNIAALLIVWFFAALGAAWLGLYRGKSSGIPTIQYGIVIPLLIAIPLFWRWRLLRGVVEAVPQQWIAGVQFFRAMGLIFVLLYAAGMLPGVFAFRPASATWRSACSPPSLASLMRAGRRLWLVGYAPGICWDSAI